MLEPPEEVCVELVIILCRKCSETSACINGCIIILMSAHLEYYVLRLLKRDVSGLYYAA